MADPGWPGKRCDKLGPTTPSKALMWRAKAGKLLTGLGLPRELRAQVILDDGDHLSDKLSSHDPWLTLWLYSKEPYLLERLRSCG